MGASKGSLVRRWWSRGTPALPAIVLLAGTLANLAVIWIPAAVGSMDGPIHIAAASDLLLYLTDRGSPAAAYLDPLWFPVPNLLPQLLMTLLLAILEPTLAEKVFLTGYVLALAAAFWYAVRSVSPSAGWLTVFIVPLTLSVAFHFGLFNYVWSLVPFLVVAGYTMRHRAALSGRHAAVLGGLMFLTYLTHLVSFVEAVMLVGTIVAAERWPRRDRPARPWRELVPLGLALLPSVALALAFLVPNGTAGSDYRRAPGLLIAGLPSLAWPLVSFDRLEAVFTSLVGLTLGVLTVAAVAARRSARQGGQADALLGFVVVSTVAYLLSPEATGSGGLITERLALYPPIGLVLWLAAQRLPSWSATVGAAAVAIALAGLMVLRWPSYGRMGADIVDYTSVAPCMARGATLVQANLWYDVPSSLGRTFALLHDGGRLAAATGGHDLGSVTGTLPLYPLQYRPDIDPFTYLVTRQNGEYEIPPGIDPLGYERSTAGRVDYVVVFGREHAMAEDLADPAWLSIQSQLDEAYRLVARSPKGLVDLWERTTSPLAADGERRRSEPAAAGCALR